MATKPQIKPDSEITLQPKIKRYTFSKESMDFGEYLNLLDIKPYDKVTVVIKKGFYYWNEIYSMPQNSELNIIGENATHDGSKNIVSITVNKETYKCFCDTKNHVSLTKLIIKRDCVVFLNCIDFYEFIRPGLNICKSGIGKGIFVLLEDNARFYFLRTYAKISSSPFINVYGQGIGKVIFGHSHFSRNTNSQNKDIIIVGTEVGWALGGNKAFVSCDLVTRDEFCIFNKNNNRIEYIGNLK